MIEKLNKSKDSWRTHSRNMTIHHEVIKFTKAFRDNFFTLMISALGLVVALSWNNFWVEWVKSLTVENTLPHKFMIAIGMTILAVIFTYLFSRMKGSNS